MCAFMCARAARRGGRSAARETSCSAAVRCGRPVRLCSAAAQCGGAATGGGRLLSRARSPAGPLVRWRRRAVCAPRAAKRLLRRAASLRFAFGPGLLTVVHPGQVPYPSSPPAFCAGRPRGSDRGSEPDRPCGDDREYCRHGYFRRKRLARADLLIPSHLPFVSSTSPLQFPILAPNFRRAFAFSTGGIVL